MLVVNARSEFSLVAQFIGGVPVDAIRGDVQIEAAEVLDEIDNLRRALEQERALVCELRTRLTPILGDLQRLIAPVLKRLYPSNPDVVLGREARMIAAALVSGPLDATSFTEPLDMFGEDSVDE